jgi:hypothetical protein
MVLWGLANSGIDELVARAGEADEAQAVAEVTKG